MSNKELTVQLYKLIIRKLEERKVQSFLTDNIWSTDLADIQLIKDLNFYYALLTFIENMHGLLL